MAETEREIILEQILEQRVIDLINQAEKGLQQYSTAKATLEALGKNLGENYTEQLRRQTDFYLNNIVKIYQEEQQ